MRKLINAIDEQALTLICGVQLRLLVKLQTSVEPIETAVFLTDPSALRVTNQEDILNFPY